MKQVKIPRDTDRKVVEAFESVRDALADFDVRAGSYMICAPIAADMAAAAPLELPVAMVQLDSELLEAMFIPAQAAVTNSMTIEVVKRDTNGRVPVSVAKVDRASGSSTPWVQFVAKHMVANRARFDALSQVLLRWSKNGAYGGPFRGALVLHMRQAVKP